MIQLSKHVRKAYSTDGGIVLEVNEGRMFSLNLTGSKILELLDRRCTPAQIAEEISREFGVGTDIALRDVEQFLGTLRTHRLVEVHTPDEPR